jgi:hypothetical protein
VKQVTLWTDLGISVKISKSCPSNDIRFTVTNWTDEKFEFATFNRQGYWLDLLPGETVVVTVPRSTMRDPWLVIAAPSGMADRFVKYGFAAC